MSRDFRMRAGKTGNGTDTKVDSRAFSMITGVSAVKTAPAVWLVARELAHLSMKNRKVSIRVRILSFVPLKANLGLEKCILVPTKNLYFSIYREPISLT